MVIKDDAGLPRLIQSLEASAREIDQTFARAGSQLGEGLTLFETLKERLSALSAELAGRELTEAGATLTGLAGELRAIGRSLRDEAAALQDLSTHGHAASQVLERLLDHMRLITILARSARIEAVSVQAIGRDFSDFTGEIVALTTQARHTIQDCVRDHERLGGLLGSALTAQRDFEGRYGQALSALADNLDETLAEVTGRQQRGANLTRDAAVHSGKIAMAAGGAIISLQSGDSIRQRLEHAITALRLIETVDGATGAGAALAEAEREAASLVLRRLQAAQLRESAATLGDDADSIESALALLADDTANLLELVRSLYRGEGSDSGSFLVALEANLAQAADLLGKCNNARAAVDRVTVTLATVLDSCQQTVAALTDTVSNIELIGMNAGLRAARVGTDGRSLVVIAQELKFAADQIAKDAHGLTPTFARMQEASTELKQVGRLGSSHFAELGLAMEGSLAAMRQAGDRLAGALEQLMREGGGFGTVLAQARLSFSNAGAMSDLIASAGDELARSAQGPQTVAFAVAGPVNDLVQTQVWPRYTMAAERVIHQSVLQEAGVASEEAASAPVTVAAAEDVDEFLF